MALQLPSNFEQDIQNRDTNLVPVVVIGTLANQTAQLSLLNVVSVISTNSFTTKWRTIDPSLEVSEEYLADINCKPLLLNIPSLKESVDIEKRNYKISSINLDISNLPYEGIRFSELADSSLINMECRVFWTSPSTKGLCPERYPEAIDEYDAFQVYNGVIRKYEHDDEKVRLVVEDRSQVTLHQDLPKNYLGTTSVPDKYKNKPIPMVYGNVDRSP